MLVYCNMSISLKVGSKKTIMTVHDSIKGNPFWSAKCVMMVVLSQQLEFPISFNSFSIFYIWLRSCPTTYFSPPDF